MPNTYFAAGLDLGTMFIQAMREDGKGSVLENTVRDCYRELEYDPEFEDTLKSQNAHYLREDKKLYVLGNEAYSQARMAEFGADIRPGMDTEILKRPMKDGVLNSDSPKVAMMIMRELMRTCLEKEIGPARANEVLYFSIPANPVDSTINNTFHSKMAESYLRSLGYDARPLGEGLAVCYAENPKQYLPDGKTLPFTGISVSHGAGQTNFCLAERGLPIDEFSIARSGDWIDTNAAKATGQPKTKILRVKERDLNFNITDHNDEILMALHCYYEELVRYVFKIFADRFKNNRGTIDHPIDIVLSGGTASPPGFDTLVKNTLMKMNLPFEIKNIRLAGNGNRDLMLKAVAKGCYIRAKQATKKMATVNNELESKG